MTAAVARSRAAMLGATATSGYVLDGLGGVTAYGGAPPVEPSRWWGDDVAVRLALVP